MTFPGEANPVFDRLREETTGAGAGEGVREYLTLRDGVRVYVRRWSPEGTPRRAVVCFHGAAGQGQYFSMIADILAADADVTVADYRGHGLSEGPRGDFLSFETLLEDCREVVGAVRARLPEVPVTILGESMGGAMAVNYAARFPEDISSLVLLAPALKFRQGLPPWPQLLSIPWYLLVALIAPGRPVIRVTGQEEKGIKNPLHVEFDKTDPLHLTHISPRYFLQLNRYMAIGLRDCPARITVPTILFQGEADAAIDPEGARRFMARLASIDKEMVLYAKGFHVLLTDPDVPDIADSLRAWILRH